MASWEHQLISRIIRTGELSKVTEWGISDLDFTTAEAQTMFGRMVQYQSSPETRGAVWGPMSLHTLYPNYVLCDDPSMTLDALCQEVRKDRVKAQTRQLILEIGDLNEYDPAEAINLLHQKAADIHNDMSPKKTDVHLADGFRKAVVDMEMIEAGMDVSVCPWPWAPIQNKTLGIRENDYIVFYGRPKSMKSWVLCYLIAWFVYHGKRILIYTKEMPAWEVCERIGCCIAQVDYERFITGTLVPDERQNVIATLHWLESLKGQSMFVVLDAKDARGKDTVSWLSSKVEKYVPEAVFVDGIYLMKDQHGAKRQNDRVRGVSQDLRQMVLAYNVPIIGTIQANRDAAKNEEANTDEIAFSDSIGQDITHLIRVVNEKNSDTLALVMGNVARRFKLNGFRIYGIPSLNFSVKDEELTAREASIAVQSDDANTKQAHGQKNARQSPKQITNANQQQVAAATNAAKGYL